VLHLLGRPAEAVADFDRALAANPDYAEALNNRGRAHHALGDTAKALADFDCAVQLSPASVAALHNRGSLHLALGNLPLALADFDRALQSDPDHVATLVQRGTARKQAGDLAGALADCDCALVLLPDGRQAAAFHLRGGIRVLQNDFAGAIIDYNRALALEPANAVFHVSRGNAHYHRRDPQALADYLHAFRLHGEAAAREFARLLAEDARRDAEGVLENCRKHLRLNSRDALAYARRGLTLVLLGKDEEALLDFSRFVDQAPQAWGPLDKVLHKVREALPR
jgi:Tfp pilus assembly protein PilF